MVYTYQRMYKVNIVLNRIFDGHYTSNKYLKKIFQKIMITDWAISCGLGVNSSKTELLLFTKNIIPLNMDLTVIDDKVLSLFSNIS